MKTTPSSIDEILEDRKNTHGDFRHNADFSQTVKEIIREFRTVRLSNVQAEALEVIVQKISRILNGNPDEEDHWIDISGYAELALRDVQRRNDDIPF